MRSSRKGGYVANKRRPPPNGGRQDGGTTATTDRHKHIHTNRNNAGTRKRAPDDTAQTRRQRRDSAAAMGAARRSGPRSGRPRVQFAALVSRRLPGARGLTLPCAAFWVKDEVGQRPPPKDPAASGSGPCDTSSAHGLRGAGGKAELIECLVQRGTVLRPPTPSLAQPSRRCRPSPPWPQGLHCIAAGGRLTHAVRTAMAMLGLLWVDLHLIKSTTRQHGRDTKSTAYIWYETRNIRI